MAFICLTGNGCDEEGTYVPRKVIKLALEREGHTVQHTFSRATEILIYQDAFQASRKMKKAQQLGVRCITYRSFWRSAHMGTTPDWPALYKMAQMKEAELIDPGAGEPPSEIDRSKLEANPLFGIF